MNNESNKKSKSKRNTIYSVIFVVVMSIMVPLLFWDANNMLKERYDHEDFKKMESDIENLYQIIDEMKEKQNGDR